VRGRGNRPALSAGKMSPERGSGPIPILRYGQIPLIGVAASLSSGRPLSAPSP